MPAISLAAVPGRRLATLDLAVEIENKGFSGIYCPSLGDSMALCQTLASATKEIVFGECSKKKHLGWSAILLTVHESLPYSNQYGKI